MHYRFAVGDRVRFQGAVYEIVGRWPPTPPSTQSSYGLAAAGYTLWVRDDELRPALALVR